MSLAVTHFAVGATLTILVVTYLVPGVRYPRAVTILGGLWAMVPDAHWVSPVAVTELRALHRSPVVDVFWFHHLLDGLDRTDSKAVAAAALGCLLVATALAERREYRTIQRVHDVVAPTAEDVED
jgi:hypothetical protein